MGQRQLRSDSLRPGFETRKRPKQPVEDKSEPAQEELEAISGAEPLDGIKYPAQLVPSSGM